MLVLGIETSCDETGVALYDSRHGLVANRLHSQATLHARYGGVVPEIAARDHVQRVLPLVREAFAEAGRAPSAVDGVAYTGGPGLIGALLVGAAIGRSLAYGWNVPAVAVHHLEAHLLAPLLEPPAPAFPFLALLVSGGHTQLVAVRAAGDYRTIGESVDDAAGEAFDKTAKLLGLGYPGGPALAALARDGDPGRFRFPRPMTDRPGLDFSFSGLKTHALRTLRTATPGPTLAADVARAFEDAVVDTLHVKSRRGLRETGFHRLVVAGGVGANRRLRARLVRALDAEVFFPRPALCTDNGAMVAFAGFLRLRAGERQPPGLGARARWPLDSLAPLDTPLLAGQEEPDVGSVAPQEQRRHQRGNAHHARMEGESVRVDRREDRRGERGQRRVAGPGGHHQPSGEEHGPEQRFDGGQYAEGGGDPLPAPEPEEHRIQVPEEGGEAHRRHHLRR